MRRISFLLPMLLGLTSAACTAQDVESGFDAIFGEPSNTEPKHPVPHAAVVVNQRNLVSDQDDVAAYRDPNLVNAWGLAFNPSGPAWVSDNGTGLSSVYDPNGQLLLTVGIPTANGGTPPSAPTGQVFNGDPDAFGGDKFIFVTEDGTISGWQPAFNKRALLRVDNSSCNAIYKGVAIGGSGKNTRLYATDFHNAKVEVFDENYQPSTTCNGGFSDPSLPAGYAPFNVFTASDLVLVSYALQDEDKEDDVKGPGHGFVDVFDLNGNFVERLLSAGVLNSPWGMAITPSGFDNLPGRLLVGNFGDGAINVFTLQLSGVKLAANFAGFVGDSPTHPLIIDGLWALGFPPNAGGFNPNDIYFTAGPDDEQHGLFGRLEVVKY